MNSVSINAAPESNSTILKRVRREDSIFFLIRGQAFCADMRTIREIRGWTEVTWLSHSLDYIRGLVNLRRTILPIIKLSSAWMGLGLAEPAARHFILVAAFLGGLAGLVVDGVSEILLVLKQVLQSPPATGYQEASGLVRGLLPRKRQMLIVLSLNDVFPPFEEETA